MILMLKTGAVIALRQLIHWRARVTSNKYWYYKEKVIVILDYKRGHLSWYWVAKATLTEEL